MDANERQSGGVGAIHESPAEEPCGRDGAFAAAMGKGRVVSHGEEHVVDDYKTVIDISKHFEARLEDEFGASGRGLHERISSCERALPNDVAKKLRLIATIRNKLIHENYDSIADLIPPEEFEEVCRAAEDELNKASGSGRRPVRDGGNRITCPWCGGRAMSRFGRFFLGVRTVKCRQCGNRVGIAKRAVALLYLVFAFDILLLVLALARDSIGLIVLTGMVFLFLCYINSKWVRRGPLVKRDR